MQEVGRAIVGIDENGEVVKGGLVDEFQSLWIATNETGEQTTENQEQKAKFEATIEASLSLGLPKDFWVKNSQFSNENLSSTSSTSSTQVQPAEDIKPQITKINITFRGIGNTKVPSSPLSNIDITADLMGEIKKAILDHNNIPVSERENTIVKVVFGGEIYKTDNSKSSAELHDNLQKLGANSCSVMVQILPPKKVEAKQEQAAVISEPTEKAASSSTSTTTASTATTTTVTPERQQPVFISEVNPDDFHAKQKSQLSAKIPEKTKRTQRTDNSLSDSKPKPPEISANAQTLINQLTTYIQRVESYKGNYSQGFWFLAGSRGINRRANYELAKQLRDELQGGADISSTFSHIESKRDKLITDKGLDKLPDYVKRGLHSDDLNAIIKTALNYSEQKDNKLQM